MATVSSLEVFNGSMHMQMLVWRFGPCALLCPDPTCTRLPLFAACVGLIACLLGCVHSRSAAAFPIAVQQASGTALPGLAGL